jgi:hypothetical protein
MEYFEQCRFPLSRDCFLIDTLIHAVLFCCAALDYLLSCAGDRSDLCRKDAVCGTDQQCRIPLSRNCTGKENKCVVEGVCKDGYCGKFFIIIVIIIVVIIIIIIIIISSSSIVVIIIVIIICDFTLIPKIDLSNL